MLYYKINYIGGMDLIKYSKFLALLLCASVALPFTGCGSTASDDSSQSSSESLDKTSSDNKSNNDSNSESAANDDIKYSDYVDIGDYSVISLTKSDIDNQTKTTITSNIEQTGNYNKVKKGTVKLGDTVNIYYVGKVDGKEFNGGSCTKENQPDGYDLKIGSHRFIDGFEDALIGKKVGKTYDIDVTFPEEYGNNTELEGKPAVFTVTINYKVVYPKLSDSFVKNNFKDFDSDYKNTANDYNEYIRNTVIEDLALKYVYDNSTVNNYPEALLDEVKTQYRTPVTYYLEQQNVSLDDYLASQNMSSEDFENQVETSAKNDLSQRLVINAIAEKENITVKEDEFKKTLDEYIKQFNVADQEELDKLLKQYYGTGSESIINNEIIYDKVKDFLSKNIEETNK